MATKTSYMDEGLDETSLAILKSFFPEGNEKSIKELQERVKYSYEPMHRTLSNLVKRKILTSRKAGKTALYTLDMKNWFVKLSYYYYSLERLNEFSHRHKLLSIALNKLHLDNVEVLIIFGSYAKGNETENSDVDVLCVSSDKKKMESEIRALTHYYKMKDFHGIVIPRKEFVKIKNENKEFWSDLVNYGIILMGSELVYQQAYL